MEGPTLLKELPGLYVVGWAFDGVGVRFQADRVDFHNEACKAYLTITEESLDGERKRELYWGNLNLAANPSQSRSGVLDDRPSGVDKEAWKDMVTRTFRLILEREVRSSPVEQLEEVEYTEPEYLVRPFLLDGVPTMLYAPGGAGKSYLSMYAALCVQNGLPFLGQPVKQSRVLILDWEATREEAGRRCTQVANGLGVSGLRFPLYKHCSGAIESEAAQISQVVAENDVGLLIVDSAGPACGGDVLSGELAIKLFGSLRKIAERTGAAQLVLSHVTKEDAKAEHQRRLPIGSVYFTNWSRAAWELRSEEEPDGHSLHLSLNCRKNNMARPEPFGARLVYGRDAVAVSEAGADDVLTESGATQAVILQELQHGPARIADLVEATGTSSTAVSVALNKMKKRGLVDNPSRGQWVLVDGATS